MTLGERLRLLRQQKFVTLREAGSAAGVSHSVLCRLEQGGRDAKLDTLRKIARYHRMTVSELLAPVEQEGD